MEKNFKRTTVTSALPYANGPVHIGHLAGVYVPADIYVRYWNKPRINNSLRISIGTDAEMDALLAFLKKYLAERR